MTGLRKLTAAWAAALGIVSSAAAQNTWTGTVDGNWSTAANWSDGVPLNGQQLNFTNVGAGNLTQVNNVSGLTLDRLTFNTSLGGPISISGNGVALQPSGTLGINNANVTAGRDVTLNFASLTLNNSQTWAAQNDNALTVINSPLTMASGLVLTLDSNTANGAVRPTIRLTGNNVSTFAADIVFAGTSDGVIFNSPQSMTSGNINLVTGSSNNTLWLQGLGSSPANSYSFGMGAGAGNVDFRDSGSNTGGLVAFGTQDVHWRINGGGNANFADRFETAPAVASINLPRPAIIWGAAGDSITIPAGQTRNFRTQATGNMIRVDYTLAAGSGTSNLTTEGGGLVALNGGSATGTTTGTTSIGGGTTLAISNPNQIFDGNLNITGVLLFDNMTWDSFAADRVYGTSGANTFQFNVAGGGFAARTSNVTILIDNANLSTPFGTLTAGTLFNRTIIIGSSARGPDGTPYANARVNIAQNTILSADIRRNYIVAAAGPGLSFPSNYGSVSEYSGNITGGSGASLIISATGALNSIPQLAEIVLSGSFAWTGSPFITESSNGVGAGPGGLVVTNNVLARFASEASFPTGNGGNPAYLLAQIRNQPIGINTGGYLLQGTPNGQNFRLPNGYQFVIGSITSNLMPGTLGGTNGAATLRGSIVNVHSGFAATDAQSLLLLVRDNSLLTLGTLGTAPDGPVILRPTTGQTVTDPGLTGPATPLFDRTGLTTLVKRGEGTLVLANISYQDGTGGAITPNARFNWQIGRNLGTNSVSAPYFDGAVRETGNTTADSLLGFNFNLNGGVVETNNTILGGSFARGIGVLATQFRWGTNGGGGFAAFGGPLTLSAVSGVEWQAGNSLPAGNPLMLNSPTADNLVTWAGTLALANADNQTVTREVRVFDNPTTSADYAAIGSIRNRGIGGTGGTGTRSWQKTGPGILVLTGPSSDFNGTLDVLAGTLRVNGTIAANAQSINVASGASLEGSGTIGRNINISGGGTLRAGDPLNAANNRLNLGGNLTLDPGSTLAIRIYNAGASSTPNLGASSDLGNYPDLLNNNFVFQTLGATSISSDTRFVVNGNGASFMAGQTYSYLVGQVPAPTQPISIINDTQFTFSGIPVEPGQTSFTVDTATGFAYLNFTVVPEPMLAVILIPLLALRRRN